MYPYEHISSLPKFKTVLLTLKISKSDFNYIWPVKLLTFWERHLIACGHEYLMPVLAVCTCCSSRLLSWRLLVQTYEQVHRQFMPRLLWTHAWSFHVNLNNFDYNWIISCCQLMSTICKNELIKKILGSGFCPICNFSASSYMYRYL